MVIGREMIETLKNGVRVMSIEARYLYSANKEVMELKTVGYDSTKFWDNESKKKKVPEKLYGVKMPYSLGLEKMYEIKDTEFKTDDYGVVYSDMIINVTFKGAAKREKQPTVTKTGKVRKISSKYLIKTHGKGKNLKAYLKQVKRLETELNTKELRKHMYKNGFILDGNEYVYFMRSTSKARGGNMLFIKKEYFYGLLIEWARLGIVFEKTQPIDVAGIKSYEALVLSGICGKIKILPEEILLINDYESVFDKEASVTKLDENNRLMVVDEEVEYRNSIWDGQSLMDFSKYKEFIEFEDVKKSESLNGKSFVLLRNLWFKSAAFNFNIQKYFADNNVTLEDVKKHGWTIAKDIKQIKLITTPNSLKILKIKELVENKYKDELDGQTRSMFEYWLRFIKDSTYFGIVKSEHGIHDHARRCNSQILMALPLSKDDIRQLLNEGEFPYMRQLRNDDDMFLMHIGRKKSSSNSMIYELASYVPKFTRTDLYTNFKNDTLGDYKASWKKEGIKIPNSDFCVCVSNPIEMIQYACGVTPDKWVRIHEERKCYCKFYENGQELIAARNPCVCSGNIVCLKNTEHQLLENYMNLSDNIVVVNSIESDIMERASSMDFDSDQMWLSSNDILVEKAKYCEEHYLTPVNKVAREAVSKFNKIEDLADTDTKISKGKIGDIVNMGQILQSYYWHIYFTVLTNGDEEVQLKEKVLKRIYDKISMLSSASGVEIDRAKREFMMDTDKELSDLRQLGILKNDDSFLREYMSYGKLKNLRKKTITKKELEANPKILDAYKKIEEYNNSEKTLTDEQKKERLELYKVVNEFLVHEHKKDNSKQTDKIIKPLYFKFAFPNSIETSIYFENGMDCPMDNLCVIVDEESPKKDTHEKKINIMELMNTYSVRGNDKHRGTIKEIASKYSKFCSEKKFKKHDKDAVNPLTKKEYFEQCVKEMKDINLTFSTIVDIFNGCYGSNQAKSHNKDESKIKKHMIDLIYAAHKDKVLDCFKGTIVFGRKCFKKVYLCSIDEEKSA